MIDFSILIIYSYKLFTPTNILLYQKISNGSTEKERRVGSEAKWSHIPLFALIPPFFLFRGHTFRYLALDVAFYAIYWPIAERLSLYHFKTTILGVLAERLTS